MTLMTLSSDVGMRAVALPVGLSILYRHHVKIVAIVHHRPHVIVIIVVMSRRRQPSSCRYHHIVIVMSTSLIITINIVRVNVNIGVDIVL